MRGAVVIAALVAVTAVGLLVWPGGTAPALTPRDARIVVTPAGAELSVTIESEANAASHLDGAFADGKPLALVRGAPGHAMTGHGAHPGHEGHAGPDASHHHGEGADLWRGMSRAAALTVPPRGRLTLPPPGARLVLPDGDSFEDGALIPVVLCFGDAGDLTLKARVERSGGMPGTDHGAAAGMHEPAPGEPRPRLSLAASSDPDGGWMLLVRPANFRFAPEAVDGPHVPGEGHAHIHVNGIKFGRLYEEAGRLPALLPGENLIRVELNTNDHRVYAVDGRPVAVEIAVDQIE